MNKDHKLMGVMVPVILILSIGVYGIPGVVGSDSNPLITAVDYKGNTTDDSSDIGSDDTDTDQSGNVSLDLQSNGDDASNTDSNSGYNTRPQSPTPPRPNPPSPDPPSPDPSIPPEPEPED
jgi:hypothetical protein